MYDKRMAFNMDHSAVHTCRDVLYGIGSNQQHNQGGKLWRKSKEDSGC